MNVKRDLEDKIRDKVGYSRVQYMLLNCLTSFLLVFCFVWNDNLCILFSFDHLLLSCHVMSCLNHARMWRWRLGEIDSKNIATKCQMKTLNV